ncbi:AroM protein [Faunimonas pinastri]|uniref:AroM protein n=1 Tax=Faunimonas pinastri TaxID=1855383 RepID=A0A1H9EAU7_9HYPH|nr:AroM family protein [Faunimonas pinastri]SEQ22068.1 AroM protein [Faunimonas pinastri]
MKKKVGIITTGQSPRTEYRSFHRNALAALGIEADVFERACLDGLTRAEIRAHQIEPADGLGIGCYVHNDTPADRRMGSGWEEIFVDQAWYIERAQAAISAHQQDGMDIILMCCAEMYPANSFRSTVPLLLPYQLMFDLVRRQTEAKGKFRLALLLPTEWHIDQDRATWTSEPWMANVEASFGIGIADGQAVEQLRGGAPYDLALIWGYGDGLAPHDPDDLLASISEGLQCPVVTPNVLNVFAARTLLTPAWPERIHVEF